MKKSARIIGVHGWESGPQHEWWPWLSEKLTAAGHSVALPLMPNPEAPEMRSWITALTAAVGALTEDTIFVGHSVGCQTILRYLASETSQTRVAGVVMVAPWVELSGIDKEEGSEELAEPWLKTPLTWSAIRPRSERFVAIFSDNDPYVPLSNQGYFEKELLAETILQGGKGHFSGIDGVTELPVLLQTVLRLANER